MPEVIIVKNETEAGEIYGRCVADLIKAKPDAVLGLATGSSPLSAYKALAKIVKDESIDVSGVRGFALDEYIGLPLTHPRVVPCDHPPHRGGAARPGPGQGPRARRRA